MAPSINVRHGFELMNPLAISQIMVGKIDEKLSVVTKNVMGPVAWIS
jgi:hypothetical protein